MTLTTKATFSNRSLALPSVAYNICAVSELRESCHQSLHICYTLRWTTRESHSEMSSLLLTSYTTITVDAYVDSYFSTQTSCSKAVALRAHSCRIQRNSFPGVATCTSQRRACITAKLCVNMRTFSSFSLPLAIHTHGACLLAGSTKANSSAFHASSFTSVLDKVSYRSKQDTYTKTKKK